MDEKQFLSRLGFSDNPFQFTNADEEDHLQTYFIPLPSSIPFGATQIFRSLT